MANALNEEEEDWATREEKEWMDLYHPFRVTLMKQVLAKLPLPTNKRALEAGCGDGRLSKDVLCVDFDKVDLFDSCPAAIRAVKMWSGSME